MEKLFVYDKTKRTSKGIIEDTYIPTRDIYIKGINRKSYPFEIKNYKIKQLSVHHGTDLWLIGLKNGYQIKVSGDHSIIVEKDNQLLDIKPSKLLQLSIGQYNSNTFLYIIENNQLKKVPVSDVVTCELIEENTVTYDFSLEGADTFFANNILVMDTVTVFMPQTEESQSDLKKMFEKTFLAQNSSFKYELSWDTVYGLYKLTKDESKNIFVDKNNVLSSYKELEKFLLQNPDKASLHVTVNIKGKKISLTLGRYLVNMLLPQFSSIITNEVLSKNNLMNLIDEVAKEEIEKRSQLDDTIRFYNELTRLGNKFCTLYPINYNLYSVEDLQKKVETYISKIEKMKLLEGMKSIEKAMDVAKKYIQKENPELYEAIDSGARGSWTDIQQMFIIKGYVTDVEGRIISNPIKSSLSKSLTKDEFFTAAYGSRKGIVDRALNTAEPGYLLRQLCIASSSITLSQSNDCKTDDGFTVKLTEKNYFKFLNRYTTNGILLTKDNADKFIGKEVKIRSPLYCETQDNAICKRCFGEDHTLHKTKYIGVLCAQALGERLQQNMLKTFHTGGIAKLDDMPYIIPKDIVLIEQKEDELRSNIKETSFKMLLKESESEYHIIQSTVIVKKGMIYLLTSTKEEKFGFEHDYILMELYPDNIMRTELTQDENEKGIMLYFNRKQDLLGRLVFKVEDISTSIKHIKKFFAGSIDYVTINDIYNAIDKYIHSYKLNSVVIETILSNMIRCQDDNTKLWRNNKNKKFELVSLKQIPALTSSFLAVGFEDIGNSIINGLVNQNKHESVLEKILKGKVDEL